MGMEKRLEVKVRKIVGQANPEEGKWSDVLTFEPEEKELEKRRGRLFAVLDLTGGARLDLSGFGKKTLGTLREAYYASEESSPLQALEEAVHKAQHRLVDLAFGPEGAASDGALNYNFATAVLWGTVLYVAKLGASGIYLRRPAERDNRHAQRGVVMEELGETRNSKIFSASGMVRDGDAVVLGSSDFSHTFSVGELSGALENLESLVSNLGRPPGISSLVLRLELESMPGEEEELKIASVIEKESGLKIFLKKFFSFLPPKALLLIPVALFLAATAWTINKRRTDFRAAETARLVSQAEQTMADARQYVDLNNSRARELLLEAKNDFAEVKDFGGEGLPADRQVLGLSKKIEEIDTLLDKVNNVKRVTPQEVESAEVSFNPLSKLASPPKVEGAVDTGTYFGNIYSLVPSENQILKAAVVAPPASLREALRAGGGDYAEPRYWVTTENPPLADAVSMAIDGFIYVLKSDGQVLKFEKGELVLDFGLKEIDQPLFDPRTIFTTIESEHLYILDVGNQRLVVTDKNGFYQSQYVFEDDQNLTHPTGLFVDEAGGAIYLLDGTKTFRVEM